MANNKRRMRGFTADGYVRIQRTVLRRVVCDRLQALLRGDFYVRNSLGGEEYEPIVKEVEALHQNVNAATADGSLPQAPAVATATSAASSGMGENNKQSQKNGNNGKGKVGMTNGRADNDITTTTTTDGKKKSTSTPPQEMAPPPSHQPSSKQLSFSTNLETFLQLIAASIMIDASMRGENAGESDTRFIKKKKKLLVKTLMGPKLPDFCKEVLRFDTVRQGGTVSDTEIVESEESKSSSSSGESSSEEEEEEEEVERQRKTKKVKVLPSSTFNNIASQPMKPTVPTTTTTSSAAAASSSTQTMQSKQEQQRHRHHPFYPSSEGGEDGSSSMDEEDDEDNSTTASDSNDEDGISSSANNSNAEENSMSLDGFSASATSSRKQQRKKEKKKLRALKKEKKRMKKEKKRREKEWRRRERERKKKKKAEKAEKERMKLLLAAETQQQQKPGGGGMKDSKKKKKRKHKSDADAENEFSDAVPLHNQNGDDYMDMEYITPLASSGKQRRHLVRDDEDIGAAESDDEEEDGGEEEDEGEGILASKEEFEQFKSDILKRVPKSVKSRFRQGGFSRWGKDWLPILELGPFDVEPGPVRDMWFDMFDNTQASGREMTRLVLWYGVKFEDRGQAYSFLPETKIVPYEEGQRNGYCKISSKIQQKIEKKLKLTKTEEQIRRGLIEIEADMARDKSDRAAWMMQFKEDYEYAEEEAATKSNKKKKKSAKAVDEAVAPLVETAKKRKPGRPKKEKEESDVPVKRKPGRPKKVVVDVSSAEEEDRVVVEVKKRGPGRPRKSEKEKEKAKAKAKAKKKESTAKKWEMIDGDEESEIETDDDESDKDYDGLIDSGDEGDMDVDGDGNDSDAGEGKSSSRKRKATSSDKKTKKKAKVFMTEEEKIIDRRAKAAEYREKKARERAEAQGLEYIKGKVGRKSKAAMIDEEQIKFTKCEEVFLPMMERLSEAKDDNNVKVVLKCIKSIMERVEMLTPPFLREYPLGMLVKTVRKSFEAVHPEVKDNCKCLTAEMKRVYTEKEPKVPEDFEPVKNKKSSIEPKQEASEDAALALACSAPESVKSESIILKADKVTIKTNKVVINTDKVDIASEPSLSKNNSEMSLSESLPQKNVGAISTECLPDVVVKSELPQPKPKRTFSIKGMFDKPKPPAEKPKLSTLPTSSSSASITAQIFVPKPKTLPPWVTGPAVKREEELCSERAFGLEFLSDAASSVVVVSTKFDPISVFRSLEVAIFAETKLRGRHWNQYWETIHDVVSILSPGGNKHKSILQGIMRGDYQDPSDVVKLSRREILNSQMSETTST